MKIFPVLRLINTTKVESLKNVIRKSIDDTPQYLKALRENNQRIVYNKISDINKWYTKIIGLDEVKMLQDKVINIQDQLLDIQERRREIGRQLNEIRHKSVELQDQLHKVKRQDDVDRFLELMKQETEVLKMEQNISRTFQEYDRTEREIFSAFTNAIRDSHEKQRAQMEYTRYFGLVLGITGSFLTFMYSTLKKHDLKNFIETHLQNASVSPDLETPMKNFIKQSNDETKTEIKKVETQIQELIQISHSALHSNLHSTPNSNNESNEDMLKNTLKVGGVLVLFYLFFVQHSS